MATFSASWTTGQTLHTSSSITNSSSVQDDVNLNTLGAFAIKCQLDFDIASGSPNGDLLVEVFGSADAGTTVDTIPIQTTRVNFTAIGNKKSDIIIAGVPWARVKVTNNTGVSVTYVGRYAYFKETSA